MHIFLLSCSLPPIPNCLLPVSLHLPFAPFLHYNTLMSDFNFSYPITVRYSDLDPQGHVNNARYLSYIEQARVKYIQHLNLWDGNSFLDIGVVIANVQIDFKAPIFISDDIQVEMRVSRLGRKSFEMEYQITGITNEKVFATSSTILVAYDYHKGRTIPISKVWREKIAAFEKIPHQS